MHCTTETFRVCCSIFGYRRCPQRFGFFCSRENLENKEKQLIFCNVSKCAVNLIAGLANIVAERNSMNEAAEKVPPVLPHQFLTLRGREFASILQNQRSCLSERWTDFQIDAIELDFQALCDAYESEDSL